MPLMFPWWPKPSGQRFTMDTLAGASLSDDLSGMSAHFQASGPRSNAYSESKFTHWAIYDPLFAEAITAYKRFDERLPKSPSFPRILTLGPLEGFIHPCNREQVAHRLSQMLQSHIVGLRAVFLLAGRRKQE